MKIYEHKVLFRIWTIVGNPQARIVAPYGGFQLDLGTTISSYPDNESDRGLKFYKAKRAFESNLITNYSWNLDI